MLWKQTRNPRSYNLVILDMSESMESICKEAIVGYNEPPEVSRRLDAIDIQSIYVDWSCIRKELIEILRVAHKIHCQSQLEGVESF